MCVCVFVCVCVCVYPTPLSGQDTMLRKILTGLNSEFSLSLAAFHTKVKNRSLSYYQPIARRKTVRFIP